LPSGPIRNVAAQWKQWYSKHYFLHVRYGGPILKHNKAGNVRINVLLSPFSVTIPAVEKQKIIKYSEYVICFLAFVIQHANHIFSVPRYIICGMSGSAIFFSIIL